MKNSFKHANLQVQKPLKGSNNLNVMPINDYIFSNFQSIWIQNKHVYALDKSKRFLEGLMGFLVALWICP